MTCNRPPAIIVNDSTLRYVQSRLSHRDQIDLAMALEQAGVDEIELGLSSGTATMHDLALVGAALRRSQPIISGSVSKTFVNAAVRAGFDAIYLSSSLTIGRGGRASQLAGIERVVSYAADRGLAVALSCEDASRTDLDLIFDLITVAETAGAHRFRYADTTGVLHPIRTHCLFRQLCAETDLELEFRGHDHFGLATANTVAAIQGGATHVSVCVTGPDLETRPAQLTGVIDAIRSLGVHDTHVDIPQLPLLAALVTARTPGLAVQKVPWPRDAPRTWDLSGLSVDSGSSSHAPQ